MSFAISSGVQFCIKEERWFGAIVFWLLLPTSEEPCFFFFSWKRHPQSVSFMLFSKTCNLITEKLFISKINPLLILLFSFIQVFCKFQILSIDQIIFKFSDFTEIIWPMCGWYSRYEKKGDYINMLHSFTLFSTTPFIQHFICSSNANAHWTYAFIEQFSIILRFISWADIINLEACEWYEHLRCPLPVLAILLCGITADFHLSLCGLFILHTHIFKKSFFFWLKFSFASLFSGLTPISITYAYLPMFFFFVAYSNTCCQTHLKTLNTLYVLVPSFPLLY